MKVIERETMIGRRVTKPDALDKATGRTRYVNDLVLPRMLYAKVYRSERTHARLKRVDVDRARGVRSRC